MTYPNGPQQRPHDPPSRHPSTEVFPPQGRQPQGPPQRPFDNPGPRGSEYGERRSVPIPPVADTTPTTEFPPIPDEPTPNLDVPPVASGYQPPTTPEPVEDEGPSKEDLQDEVAELTAKNEDLDTRVTAAEENSSKMKKVAIGVGVGAALIVLILSIFLVRESRNADRVEAEALSGQNQTAQEYRKTQNDLDSANSQVRSLQAELDAAKTASANANGKIAAANKRADAEKARADKAQEQVKDQQQEIKDKNREIAGLNKDLEKAEKRPAETSTTTVTTTARPEN